MFCTYTQIAQAQAWNNCRGNHDYFRLNIQTEALYNTWRHIN